jgi:hypothetical protein
LPETRKVWAISSRSQPASAFGEYPHLRAMFITKGFVLLGSSFRLESGLLFVIPSNLTGQGIAYLAGG